MKFEQKGNLGKTDLLIGHLAIKQMYSEDGSIQLSKEEVEEIQEQLDRFRNLMANLNLHSNSLANNGFNALVSVVEEIEEHYRNYNPKEGN
jgi:hypothetical protein